MRLFTCRCVLFITLPFVNDCVFPLQDEAASRVEHLIAAFDTLGPTFSSLDTHTVAAYRVSLQALVPSDRLSPDASHTIHALIAMLRQVDNCV